MAMTVYCLGAISGPTGAVAQAEAAVAQPQGKDTTGAESQGQEPPYNALVMMPPPQCLSKSACASGKALKVTGSMSTPDLALATETYLKNAFGGPTGRLEVTLTVAPLWPRKRLARRPLTKI